MASSSRQSQIDLSVTPFYHCISRCVRRAFLCGEDKLSGQNYDHRKDWFIDRLRVASEVFAIDVCAYAVMSNHFHVVLRVDQDRAAELSDEAVLRRTAKLFPFVAQSVRALATSPQKKHLAVLRSRLTDISWFMRIINEHVARRANKEDRCTGRFWEGRFKSQALLDESALYTCMSYVDLNPVRAGMADTLESSQFTSIQQRLREQSHPSNQHLRKRSISLAPLRAEKQRRSRPTLEMRFDDYRELLEWTGRAIHSKPSGTLKNADTKILTTLPTSPPALFTRLHINPRAWLHTMSDSDLTTSMSFGTEASMDEAARRQGKRWLKGKRAAQTLFSQSSIRSLAS